jgi:site-specific DNA recombinase
LRITGSSTEPDALTRLAIPFAASHLFRKGIAHTPADHETIDPQTRDKLLEAIARARRWMDSIIVGKVASFDDIASTEGLAERYVRRLAVLAFLSPKIVQAIAEGTAPTDLSVSRLTQALPHSWSAQEQAFSLR